MVGRGGAGLYGPWPWRSTITMEREKRPSVRPSVGGSELESRGIGAE